MLHRCEKTKRGRGIAITALASLALLLATAAQAAPRAGADEGKPKGADAKASHSASPVDVNSATVEELMAVKGIGVSLAQRIVEFREKNGPYKDVDDLLKVQGIGEKSLDRIREFLSVGKGRGK